MAPSKTVSHGKTPTSISSPASSLKSPCKKSAMSPKSVFQQGFCGNLNKLNDEYKLFVVGFKQDYVAVYVQKGHVMEEAFLAYDFNLIKNDPMGIGKQLDVNIVLSRRGPDGSPLPQKINAEHNWKQWICCIGRERNNPEDRKKLADKFIEHLNETATETNYKWPKKVKFGGDMTTIPMGAVDTVLVDNDVMKLMAYAYPNHSFSDLAEFPQILEDFFTVLDPPRIEWIRTYDTHYVNGKKPTSDGKPQ